MPRNVRLPSATALLGVIVILAACGTNASSPNASGPNVAEPVSESSPSTDRADGPADIGELTSQTFDAGGVEVVIQPQSVTAAAAVFAISLDTHSVELAMDPANIATLEIGGVEWPVDSWDGDPVGGHHRSGTLSFVAAGPVGTEITIELTGFPAPVSATWQLDS